jgi:hypothetical protein
MALNRKPKSKEQSKKNEQIPVPEEVIANLINKGGTSGDDTSAKVDTLEDETIKRVQLRVANSKLTEIDKVRKKRPGKLSRHTWIMEAIEEKLQRDTESS